MSRRKWLQLGGFVLGINILGALPAVFFGTDTGWIDQPWFFPPEWLFPVAWTVLFSLMGVALFLVWDTPSSRQRTTAVTIFAVQFLLNLLWTPAFFGLQRPGLGLVVIGALWIAIVGSIAAFARVQQTASILLIPYLLWVSFAAILNYAIYAA